MSFAQRSVPVNYKIIGEAVEYYSKQGYQYVEAPWLVSHESVTITLPPSARVMQVRLDGVVKYGYLVGSGEQSFLEIRDDLCPGRKYQCVTPCFRDEPEYDELRLPYFLKVELILPLWKTDDPEEGVKVVIRDAGNFFCKYTGPTSVQTEIGTDLCAMGVELGSYGWREHEGFRWVYGTGVAEPRLSQVMRLSHEAMIKRNREKQAEWEKENPEIAELLR